MSKMYIAVLDEFPDFMTPALVAHTVLAHHDIAMDYSRDEWKGEKPYTTLYRGWKGESFKKVVLRVNQKEFDNISQLPNVTLSHESNTLDGKKACAVVVVDDTIPNVLKFAKLWEPVQRAGD